MPGERLQDPRTTPAVPAEPRQPGRPRRAKPPADAKGPRAAGARGPSTVGGTGDGSVAGELDQVVDVAGLQPLQQRGEDVPERAHRAHVPLAVDLRGHQTQTDDLLELALDDLHRLRIQVRALGVIS